MARVIFYQKPGCATNRRQLGELEAAGHEVEARSLLAEPWTALRLADFFRDTPVASWFNPASPRLKSGEIDPASCMADEALTMMLADPLLIRRPLVMVGEARCAGFDREPVLSLLAGRDLAGLQGCAHDATGGRCAENAGD